ncbi:MAG: type I-MYXAN CRISPR-associated protein Cas5/Cmx5/DevS [Deltaproteobacteria bacterium]|nr:type I-MYXAN CRISPR-associated protein Cas5/Cmx5/DevS [Deltaproteobacteria bacterium]
MTSATLYVSVPAASFRVAQARELFETYPVPPPATVFGMLLSLVGEANRLRHAGAELGLAMLSEPSRSVVLRKVWRIKSPKNDPGVKDNCRPDFQELLSDIRLAVWVRSGPNEAQPALADRVVAALASPASIQRFGGLSLGESTHLVDELRGWRHGDAERGRVLVNDPEGDLALPVWPDHVGSRGTRWAQFRLAEGDLALAPPPAAWTRIDPPPVPAAAPPRARGRRRASQPP